MYRYLDRSISSQGALDPSAIEIIPSIFPQRCSKGKISFLSHTEYLLSTEGKGILKVILKLSSCQAALLYPSIDAPRLFQSDIYWRNPNGEWTSQ